MPGKSIGIVTTQLVNFCEPPDEFVLESGEALAPLTLAYETYGRLNKDRSNAVLICHALSGDAHVAGFHKGDHKPGWWDALVGPGKAFDTGKYFILCSNVLGGCRGSSGPGSINPKTGKPYGLYFPLISIGDMVKAQQLLISHLGIDKLLTVAGGSMGGMQALEWLRSAPDRICSAVIIAAAAKHSPQQIAFNEVGRQAIMADHNWQEGNYYEGRLPSKGLAVARMVGHITYMSDASMLEKFGRQLKNDRQPFKFTADFEVESYLQSRGDIFVKRFDANSYLYITKAMDYFDLTREKPLPEVLRGITASMLVIAFRSDWLYPAWQSQEIVKACKIAGINATYCEIDSSYGHDAFLLEIEEESHLISHFLKKVCTGNRITDDYTL
ncbi:MAG: homoserine O-acetyltransferase [Pseudomonadota bacterium]